MHRITENTAKKQSEGTSLSLSNSLRVYARLLAETGDSMGIKGLTEKDLFNTQIPTESVKKS
jgi:hypothetical protein